MIPTTLRTAIAINAPNKPIEKNEALDSELPPLTLEANDNIREMMRRPYRTTVTTGKMTAIKLAVNPNFLPASNDKLTPQLVAIMAIYG